MIFFFMNFLFKYFFFHFTYQAQLSLPPLLPFSPTNSLSFLRGGKSSLEESTESGRSSWGKTKPNSPAHPISRLSKV